jgi:ketosteroid isomerase-like protein
MPPQETSEVLHRYAEAWKAGDLVRILDAYADDVVFHYFGTHAHAGRHVGKDAAVAAMAAVSSKATRTLLEIEDVLVGDGDRGAILATERLERDGDAVEVHRALHYRVAGGRIVECWLYDQDQQLIDRMLR